LHPTPQYSSDESLARAGGKGEGITSAQQLPARIETTVQGSTIKSVRSQTEHRQRDVIVNSSSSHVLLLTGRPGVGKTTVICRVAASLPGWRLAGFYTEEVRVAGQRQGFRAVTFDRSERIMAHLDFRGPRVGKYGVDVSVIDQLADAELNLNPEVNLYLVDEIGKMECLSQRFIAAIRELLNSKALVLATIAQRGGGLIEKAKQTKDAELWEVTRANRDDLPERVLAWLRAARQSGRNGRGHENPL
jgi:nucleoside-triphosphatase